MKETNLTSLSNEELAKEWFALCLSPDGCMSDHLIEAKNRGLDTTALEALALNFTT